jgi:membrane-bound metal-dependent hydrolase YbcI (DUF457 family)
MDNITHTLVAFTLARTSLGRAGPGSTATLVLASNAPDLDIVSAIGGGVVGYLGMHRGPTHGPIGIVSLAVMAATIVRLVTPGASLDRLARIALAGVAIHVLMDLPTSYGTRLLAPFGGTWYAFDWVPIIDVYLLAVLAAGLIAGWLLPRTATTITIGVLATMVGNYALRGAAHELALARASGGRPASCDGSPLATWSDDGRPREHAAGCVAAVPTFVSPLRWRIIRRTTAGYEVYDLDLVAGRANEPVNVTDERGPWVDRARSSGAAELFLQFARFATARVGQPEADGSRTVSWTDLRFTEGIRRVDPRLSARGPFTMTVRLDAAGRLIDARLGARPAN